MQLEELGFTHGDLTVQNINIDDNNCLKLFNLDSVMRKTHNTFHHTLKKNHINLMTYLYFLLTGVNLIVNAKDQHEVCCIQKEMREG